RRRIALAPALCSRSERTKAFGGLLQRRIVLREAEAERSQGRRIRVERRDRDGCDAGLEQHALGKLDIGDIGNGAEVEKLEIRSRRRRPTEARVSQALEEQIALALIELRERCAVLRRRLEKIGDRMLQRSSDAEGVELVHAPNLASD